MEQDQAIRKVTVDEIVLKDHDSHLFEDERHDTKLVYFEEEGHVICAKKVFTASLPGNPPLVEPQYGAEYDITRCTAVELLKVIIRHSGIPGFD